MKTPKPASCVNTGGLPAEPEIEMPKTSQRDEIFTHAQPLRAYAVLLVGDREMADDLAEETLRRVWRDFATFPPGGSLRGWLFTILGTVLGSSPSVPSGPAKPKETGPKGRLQDLGEFRRAFAALPVIQREALLLTVAAGFSNPDAARISGCSGEAIRDRADRGRQSMADMLVRN